MERTVLYDYASTVNAHNFTVGESRANNLHCLAVEVGLIVSRAKYRIVYHQEVGVCGWQPFPIHDYGTWGGEDFK